MKKYFLYSLFLCFILSCEENVKFNNPSFQGVKDNVFWRAVTATATISSGGVLTINAYTRNEQAVLKTSSASVNTYTLGTNNINTATFITTEPTEIITFATSTGKGDGQISITEYDTTNKTISGTFRFNAINTAINPTTGTTLNFQEGVFYKIPITP
ncbi:DUF6252 family protein [Flavobacterium sp. UMI-01]|uniref:DUF6252 family protein n=1 Tax=Flavobacterium sp. UMI-01 TaxID=1441053 RepID=UPI001C7D0586|nr:DUF6252 family protein [Flavobacterium sp. UMI-01]GIZ09064.1 hypothetical protein FUMI01_17910 [Flavobacterium sp. UMI-01]